MNQILGVELSEIKSKIGQEKVQRQVSTVMANQVRDLAVRSINEYLRFIRSFEKSKYLTP